MCYVCITSVVELFAIFALQAEGAIPPATPTAAAEEDSYSAVAATQVSAEVFACVCPLYCKDGCVCALMVFCVVHVIDCGMR